MEFGCFLVHDALIIAASARNRAVLRIRARVRIPIAVLSFRSHLGYLHVVVSSNTANGDDEARDVDDSELVVENHPGCGDRDNFLEYAADTQGDDR